MLTLFDVLLLVEVDDVELLVVVVLVARHTRQNRFQISLYENLMSLLVEVVELVLDVDEVDVVELVEVVLVVVLVPKIT